MRIEPGHILLDKYRVERIIGRGGMGIVVKVHHLVLDEPFAMKLLRHDLDRDDETMTRFVREARTTIKLKGDHVCRVYDVGIIEDGAPYMVMEYIKGQDLSHYLHRHGRIPTELAIEFVVQACQALTEAHSLGIVHRDLKPANLYVAEPADGRPIIKVLDFGVSKLQSDFDFEETHNRAVVGTPAYMSPEQLRSAKHVDARTDIWALGVILYELLSGHRPFDGDCFSSLCLQVATQAVMPLPGSLPTGLAEVVMRCLAKVPNQRYQTTAELAVALAPYLGTPSYVPFAGSGPWPHIAVGDKPSGPVSGRFAAMLHTPSSVSGNWSTLDGSAGQNALLHVNTATGARMRARSKWLIGGFLAMTLLVLAMVGASVSPTEDDGPAGDSELRVAPASAPPNDTVHDQSFATNTGADAGAGRLTTHEADASALEPPELVTQTEVKAPVAQESERAIPDQSPVSASERSKAPTRRSKRPPVQRSHRRTRSKVRKSNASILDIRE